MEERAGAHCLRIGDTHRAERERDGGAGEGRVREDLWVAGLPLPRWDTPPLLPSEDGAGGGGSGAKGRGTRGIGEAFVPKEAARPAAPPACPSSCSHGRL